MHLLRCHAFILGRLYITLKFLRLASSYSKWCLSCQILELALTGNLTFFSSNCIKTNFPPGVELETTKESCIKRQTDGWMNRWAKVLCQVWTNKYPLGRKSIQWCNEGWLKQLSNIHISSIKHQMEAFGCRGQVVKASDCWRIGTGFMSQPRHGRVEQIFL